MTIESAVAFTGMVTLLVVSPGPNTFLIIKNVPISGMKTGLLNTAGIVSAIIIHGVLALLGLSSIIMASATLFSLIKTIGALYLCYLGFQTLMVSCKKKGQASPCEQSKAVNKKIFGNAYVQGLVINLLNPKTTLFYLAIFSQFIQKGSTGFDGLFLILIHGSIAFTWYALVSAGLQKGKKIFLLKTASFPYVQRVSGIVFIFSGLRLAMSQK